MTTNPAPIRIKNRTHAQRIEMARDLRRLADRMDAMAEALRRDTHAEIQQHAQELAGAADLARDWADGILGLPERPQPQLF